VNGDLAKMTINERSIRMTVRLGQRVRDVVTGFEGIVVSRVEYLSGCVQYCVKPHVGEDGKMLEGEYIDEQRIEIVGDGKTVIAAPTGGVMSDTPRDRYSP